MGKCKLNGSMMSHTIHSCITIKILDICVWNVIVCLVMHIITCLEYERLYVVFEKYVRFPIIGFSGIDIITLGGL